MDVRGSICFNSSWKFLLVLFPFTFIFTFIDGFHDSTSLNTVGNCSLNTTVLPMTQTEKESSVSMVENALTVVLAADMLHVIEQQRKKNQAREKCTVINGTYIEGSGSCLRMETLGNGTTLCQASRIHEYLFILDLTMEQGGEYWLYITGNTFSIASTTVLLITYIVDKELHTSYGRCIVLLSVNTMFQQALQILSLYAKESVKCCTAIAILHHWSYLAMFAWMASIAFDFAITFSNLRRPTKELQQQRMKIYVVFSQGIPTAIIALCVIIDYTSHKTYFGYGENSACFISNNIANIVTFSLPIGCIIIFNIICLGVALVFINKTRRNSRLVLRTSRRNGNMTIIILALKLSFLLGLGWIFGPIAKLTLNETVLYIYVFFSTFQGFFIFGAFCANQNVLRFYRQTIRLAFTRVSSSQNTRNVQETKF